MKRAILFPVAVLIFLLIAAVSAPFWFGIEAEKSYQKLLANPAPGGVTVTDRGYTRGWLSSTAETEMTVRGVPFQLIATHHISHGPLPLDRLLDGHPDFTPVQAVITTRVSIGAKGGDPALQAELAQLPELTARTTIHFDGSGVTHLDLPAFKQSGADGAGVDWRGLTGDVRFDRDWKQFQVELQSPGVVIAGAAGKGGLKLEKLSVKSDLQEGIQGYMLGETTVGIDRVGVGNDLATAEGISVRAAGRAVGDMLNYSLSYRLRDIQTAQQRQGPGELSIELRNLDAATLRKFENEVDAMSLKGLPPQQASMMLTGKLMELAAALAKKSPEIEVTRLSFKSGDGELTGHGKLAIDGRNGNIAENPMLLLTAVHGDAELSLPPQMLEPMLAPLIERDLEASVGRRGGLTREDFARLTPEAKARIVEQALPLYLPRHPFTRMLVADNGRYKLSATLKNGQVLVNGQPWNMAGAATVANAEAELAPGKQRAVPVAKRAKR